MRKTVDPPAARKAAAPARDRRQKVQGAEMGMQVLKTLASMGGAASLTALSHQVGESPAKVHRYLASLVASGMVSQDASASRYVLGPETINIGLAAMRQLDVVSCSAPVMATLAETHHLSCCLGILGNGGPVIVRWEEPMQPVTVNVRIGSVLPVLWSATGRAFAAFSRPGTLDAEVQRELKEATPEQRKELPNRKAVEAMLEEIRAQGCVSIRGVLLSGINAVAVPVFDAASRLAGVVTALGVAASFDPDPDGPLGRLVKASGAEVSARLGYRP
jgi:DNA-binding IclR family transcriptional regulator